MTKLPKFKSIEEERKFWDTHDVFDVLGEEGWKVVQPGTTEVRSVYIATVGDRGAVVRLPKELLDQIGAKKGEKVKAWVEGNRLVIELV